MTLRPRRPTASGVPASGPATTAPAPTVPAPTTPSTVAPTTAAPTGISVGLASQVPVGGSARFTDPASGDPGLVLQLTRGSFVAYDAICPHAGCTVGYSSAANLIVCPCHGSEFDPQTGAVVNPPAQHGLSPIQVAVDSSGQLVVER